ncbi:uncharacterized protein EDB91DRAFT_1248037 [Suillus paluster]|uniref:uncharacterized protein n=1 Tax=Suillus paluster TaxID=48578 RepID=UPI001B86DDD6|nr:uncharacterized protein EDB91DRAFT_1248037 [Suillus paluster]KAG1741482.1 hypothetical protein EDB91DRAFT_1248037 [Suillus paluster]
MPDDSHFNFTYNGQILMAEATHGLNDDVNPSQKPGAMLYTAYQIDSDEPSLSALSSSSPHIIQPFLYSHPVHEPANPQSESFHQHISTPTLDPNEKERLIMEATSTAFLTLYQYNELEVQINDLKVWELRCPRGCWIKSGIRSYVKLSTRGQFMPLEQHYGACHEKSKVRDTVKESRLTLATAFVNSELVSWATPNLYIPDSPPTSDMSQASTAIIAPLQCPGFQIVDWPNPVGTPTHANLPWLRLAEGPDKLSFDIEVISRNTLARSFDCTQKAGDDAGPCDFCVHLEPKLKALAENARVRRPHTRRRLLTPLQLVEVIHERDQNMNALKLRGLNDSCKIRRLLSELEDHTSLVMALAQSDVPWLWNLLQMALRNGASISAILRKIEEALEWSPVLPQPTSHYSVTKNTDIIQQNITSVALVPCATAGLMTLCGVSLLVDETALEEAAVYLPQSNSIGGLCWTHSSCVDVTLNNYHSALNIADALKAGRVHLGKEIMVVGAHVFSEDGLYPILVAPTCKSEDASDMEFIFNTTINSWYASGADKEIGPIWSFATDGDATRRKAGHRTFIQTPLPLMSPLYGTLSNLPGLNLLTGAHEIMLDFDYKHVFKRFSTLICSRAGMHLNNGRAINSTMLERYLLWVEGIDEARALKLLYPDDPQDVPRAVELMNAVIALGDIKLTQPSVDTIADFDAIRILSRILHSLLRPFIDITLLLTQQVISISCCAHLLYACFWDQRCSLMPNQLYYDTQTLFKNTVFCIKKQQKLNPQAPFSLLDVGDDAIELCFTFLCMCGGHNSAINYKQSLDQLGAARDIGGVYSRNPDIAHGHRRLNLTRSEAVDHIGRSMWVSDIISGNCDLQSAWEQGRHEATNILQLTQMPVSTYDFDSYFFPGSGINLQCVFGEGRYPSVDDDEGDEDRSLIALLTPTTPTTIQDLQHDPCPAPVEHDKEDELALKFEEMLDDTSETTHVELDHAVSELAVSELEPSPTAPPSGPGIRSTDFVWCDKKWVHKQSVCRLIITPNFTPKSQARLFRVQGFLSVNKRFDDVEIDHVLHGDQFLMGDLFLTLIRTTNKVLSLALVRATSISENSTARTQIKTATLTSPRGNVKVTGEILTLVPSRTSEPDVLWVWTGSYLKTTSIVPGMSMCTLKVVTISIPGHLLELVNPRVMDAQDHLSPEQMHEVNSKGVTWAVANEALQAAVGLLWMKVVELKMPINSITSLASENSGFPYKTHIGSDALVCAAGTEILTTSGRGQAVTSACPLCGDQTKDLRSHMGIHILHAARGVTNNIITPIDGSLPCGFCGESNNPDCALTLKDTCRMWWEMKCPRKESFQYGSAIKGSNTCPCRNVPIVCKLCVHHGQDTDWRPAVWRYNLETHLDQQHPEYAHPGKPAGALLPRNMYDALALTAAEEKKAGVPARPAFTFILENKENQPASSSHNQKRKPTASQTVASAASLTKRACH